MSGLLQSEQVSTASNLASDYVAAAVDALQPCVMEALQNHQHCNK